MYIVICVHTCSKNRCSVPRLTHYPPQWLPHFPNWISFDLVISLSMKSKQMRVVLNSRCWQLRGSRKASGSFHHANRLYATQNLAKGGPFAYTWLTKTAEETVSKINISMPLIIKLNNSRHQMMFWPVFLQGLWAHQLRPLLYLSSSSPQASPTGLILLVLSCHNLSVAFTATPQAKILSTPLQPWLMHSRILHPKTQT